LKVNKRIPVKFEKVDQIDDRFVQVKIWLMHLGKNYNNSFFDKEVVLEAIPTLKNTPILGYIEESKLGEKDFRGHEVELVVENGELKTKYIGRAYGVIPENCNPRFETKLGDFGQELEYLVVDGLLWTKFEDAVNILEQYGEVGQSMELHDDYDGYFNEDGVFVFTRFSFYGACMLGQDVLPAMQKASVEKVLFSQHIKVFQDEIARKLDEFNQVVFSKNHCKEVEHEMTLEELLSKYNVSVEDLSAKGIDVNEFSIEELEVKIQEVFSSDEENNQDQPSTEMEQETGGEDNSTESNEGESDEGGETGVSQEFEQEDLNESEDNKVEDETLQKFTIQFELSHDDIRRKIYEQIDSYMETKGFGNEWYYIVSVYETYLIAENEMGDRFFKVEYEKQNDSISLGNVTEVYPMFLTAEEKGALELMRSNFESLEQENKELKQFKADVLKAQHEAKAEELFAKFSKLTADEIAELREKVHEFTIEELESKLYELVGRKMVSFSREEKPTTNRLKITFDHSENRISSYDHIFKKHGLIK
jgi:hypothetical protein